jgi:PDZ domain
MRAWLGRMPWAVAWLVFVSTIGAAIAAAPPADQLRDLVRQLDADDFAMREEAGRKLVAAGEAAIEPLADAIISVSPEAAWRASGALEQIALHGSDASLSRVAATLDRLSKAGKPGLAGVVNELHSRYARLRHDRAAARIRSLGGRFDSDEVEVSDAAIGLAFAGIVPRMIVEPEEEARLGIELPELEEPAKVLAAPDAAPEPAPAAAPAPDPPPDLPPDEAAPPADAVRVLGFMEVFIADAFVAPDLADAEPIAESADAEESLVIDANWLGGDEGLAALRDLPSVTSLAVLGSPLTDAALAHVAALPRLRALHIECTPFTVEGLSQFRARRPNVQVYARGKAMLGVTANLSGPCVVTQAVANLGAAEAGIQAGDEIVAVEGHKISDFGDLMIAVFTHQPGEKIAVEFQRDGKNRSVDVVLKDRKLSLPATEPPSGADPFARP